MKYRSVICVIVKNEQRFIREWVEHNLNIGFDKLYIYEDYGSDSHGDILQDYINSGNVELISLDKSNLPITKRDNRVGNCTQFQLFNWFINSCKSGEINADWVGFFDPDEFLFFDDQWNLERIEDEFKNYGGVMPCWIMYGADGNIKRPEGNVVDNYKAHMPLTFVFEGPMWNHKSLVNVKNTSGILTNHTFKGCVFTNSKNKFDSNTCFQKCHLNHYYTKSWEDYCDRMQRRGNMANNARSYDAFFACSPELADKQKQLLNSIRYTTTNLDTMWISRKHKIISGGNMRKLRP